MGEILDIHGRPAFRIVRKGCHLVVGAPGNQRALRCPSAGRARAVETLAKKLHALLPQLEVEALLGYIDDACDADHADGPVERESADHLAWAQGWAIAAREMRRAEGAQGEHAVSAWAWSIAARRLLWGLLGTKGEG